MRYSNTEIQAAVEHICSQFGIPYPHHLQDEYELGLYPGLLSYEKLIQNQSSISALEKYIIGASSYLHQPCNYYDIFRACRHVSLIQPLSGAIRALAAAKTDGLDRKLKLLEDATDYDEFEAQLFELVVAMRYLANDSVRHVEFINETSNQRTPDLLIVDENHRRRYCECKKLDRTSDFSISMRNDVRIALNPVIEKFRENKLSVVVEISFFIEPSKCPSSLIAEAAFKSLNSGVLIVERDFHIKTKRLDPYHSSTYKLYPSPDFFWGRYEFRERSEWFGIVHQIYAQLANHVSAENRPHGTSTWLNDIIWDTGIKWKIGSPTIIAKYKRFSFDLIFSGLDQINKKGFESILHVWLESSHPLGNRRESMLDLYERIKKNERDFFGWLILNEIYFDVSPKGFFDLIEHAHMIEGPLALAKTPLVSTIFTEQESDDDGQLGEFGVGKLLPDIDET